MSISCYEFHISKNSRLKYNIQDYLLSTNGKLIFRNKTEIRKLAYKFNENREDIQKVTPGELNAAGLLDEVIHSVFLFYKKNINPGSFKRLDGFLIEKMGKKNYTDLIKDFTEKFPPKAVYQFGKSISDYLFSDTQRKNISISIEELILLNLNNSNPASKKIKELFDDSLLKEQKLYIEFIEYVLEFFDKELPIKNENIIKFIKKPLEIAPDDYFAQLEFVKANWKEYVEPEIFEEVLISQDLLKEQTNFGVVPGNAPSIVPAFDKKNRDEFTIGKSGFQYAKDESQHYEEEENFTPDIHWMPRVVLLAKNVYVWLDQLSKKYKRHIKSLDQIPDQELDLLSSRNFTGLWLIGLWERSTASKTIKNIMGNPEAVASAYSLFDYEIAQDLGSEQAIDNLHYRCEQRGIRLASDMVPNHTGIFSRWIIEYPDFFIQSNVSPYPNYTFNGENLSSDQNIEIKIEDGYYNHSDASIVFRRIDKRTGDTRYIYHGNDGTNMPWNDTAQLNFLKPEVREAVIQKIFRVADKFSIIRFDAAMTLAKKHFQRLWFPQPGTGGDIPTRSDYSMSRDKFDELFPKEFWREVVDRVNESKPETLLLAEAFWLMEGYFVRTLGMHRVYNSAFMNMMMREENDKYKQLIKNTLEFDPDILKRYVNFMSNPDEETAIKQFGTGDKYFGVCLMMCTLPGLPMFAHGQIEGYSEKYGMEYKRAYYNEEIKDELIDRHNREIFPLLEKRYLFSEVDNFWFYDFYDNFGNINDNVFAYTNKFRDEKVFVLYNNKYDSTEGYIKRSTSKAIKSNDNKELVQTNIVDALGLKQHYNCYYIICDVISKEEFLFNSTRISSEGMKIKLNGFEQRVFVDFKEIWDESEKYEELEKRLNGSPVRSVEYEIQELILDKVHNSINHILSENSINGFIKNIVEVESKHIELAVFTGNINNDFRYMHFNIDELYKLKNDCYGILQTNEKLFSIIKELNKLNFDQKYKIYSDCQKLEDVFQFSDRSTIKENVTIFLMSRILVALNNVMDKPNSEEFEEFKNKLHLNSFFNEILKRTGKNDYEIYRMILFVNQISLLQIKLDELESANIIASPTDAIDINKFAKGVYNIFEDLLNNDEIEKLLGVNEHKGIIYFSKENFEELVDWCITIILIDSYEKMLEKYKTNTKKIVSELSIDLQRFCRIKEVAEKSEYKFEKLKELLFNKKRQGS